MTKIEWLELAKEAIIIGDSTTLNRALKNINLVIELINTEEKHYRCTKCGEIVPKATKIPTIAKDW